MVSKRREMYNRRYQIAGIDWREENQRNIKYALKQA
jgi:hypothetical protein